MTILGIPTGALYATFLAAGAGVLGVAMAPGPHRVTGKEFSTNPGDASDLWPYFAGTVELYPHLINYFDFDSTKVKNDVGIDEIIVSAGISALGAALAVEAAIPNLPTGAYPPGKGSKMAEAAVIGGLLGGFTAGLGAIRTESYRYYLGFLYGIANCGGTPIDAIEAVKWDDHTSWTGSAADGSTFLIDDPQCWGGDHKAGGNYFLAEFYGGRYWPDQQPSAYLKDILGSGVTAFSGHAVLVLCGPSKVVSPGSFSGESGYFAATAGEAPAVRPVKVRVRRQPSLLGVPEFKAPNSTGANTAELAYEWLTCPSFGAKRATASKIDLASFQAGAEQNFNDGLGFSEQFNSKVDVPAALDIFTNHSQAIIYGGFRGPGTIKWKSIRRDYSIGSIPVFRYGGDGSDPALYNVISIEGFSPRAWSNTSNDATLEYTDIANNFMRTTVPAQDLANRMLTGRQKSVDHNVQGVDNGATAALVNTRELRAVSYPFGAFTLHVNRDGYVRSPGDVIRFYNNVENYVKTLRIAEVRVENFDTSNVILFCTEDLYGVSDAIVGTPTTQPSSGIGTPVATASGMAKVQEAPYLIAQDDDAKLLVFAAKPNGSQISYDAYVSSDGGSSYVQQSSSSSWAITGTISESVDRLSAAVLPSLTFTPSNALEASRLASATEAQVGEKRNSIFWDDGSAEFGAVETITNNGDGTYTLTNVWRATHDSVPSPHPVASRIWFFTYGQVITNSEYAEGITTRTKVLPKTISQTLAIASATAVVLPVGHRALKPHPVRGVTVAGDYLETEIGASDDLTVAWQETNRLTETLLVKQTDTGVTPEDTTTYTVRFYATESGSALLHTESAIPAGTTTATMTAVEEAASPAYLGHLSFFYRVEIDVVRDGIVSNTYVRELTRAGLPTSGYGIDFGNSYGD